MPGGVQRALMTGAVNAHGHAAGHREPAGGKAAGKAPGCFCTQRAGVTGADHGDLRVVQGACVAAHKEHRRRVADGRQQRRILGVIQKQQLAALMALPLQRHLQTLVQLDITPLPAAQVGEGRCGHLQWRQRLGASSQKVGGG